MLKTGGVRGNGLSPKSINGVLSVLSNIFKYCSLRYDYALPDVKKASLKQPVSIPKVLSLEEQKVISLKLLNEVTL